MDYEFFLSYTRANNDDFLRLFFSDLSEAIRDARGLQPNTEVGFLDQRDIELGTLWEKEIQAALETAKTMVCVYSPVYFRSEYCGREWQAFYHRCDQSVRLGAHRSLPPLIKPVPWITPLPRDLAPLVAGLQYSQGNPAAVVNQRGLKYVMKQMGTYRKEYVDYVTDLAREIVQAADDYPLAPLPGGLPLLSVISSAFTAAPAVAPGPLLGPPLTASKHIRFFVAAADPQTFQGRRSLEPYLDHGGSDWKPFLPKEPRSIGALAQNIVSEGDLDLTSDVSILDAGIKDAINRAWEERKIVVLLVDGWTVYATTESREILADFDRENYYNCSVLVPWNDDDPEIAPRRADIEQSLQQAFFFRANAKNPIFYRDSIRSREELREALREVIPRLRAEIRNRAKPVKPVPQGIALSMVSGPGV